jgi:hypothetical protein
MARSGHSAKSRWPVSRRVTFARVLKLKLTPIIDHVSDVVTRRLGHSSLLSQSLIVAYRARLFVLMGGGWRDRLSVTPPVVSHSSSTDTLRQSTRSENDENAAPRDYSRNRIVHAGDDPVTGGHQSLRISSRRT